MSVIVHFVDGPVGQTRQEWHEDSAPQQIQLPVNKLASLAVAGPVVNLDGMLMVMTYSLYNRIHDAEGNTHAYYSYVGDKP